MASNNRKAPPRWPPKNNDDRNRHPASRAQQTGGSLHAKRRVDNKKVQETLDDMFVNIFDSEIIRSVAHSCGWKLNKSIEALIMLAEGSDFPDTKSTENFGNSSSQSNSVPSCRESERSSSMIKPRCERETNFDKTVPNDYHNKNMLSCKNKSTFSSKSKSVLMNASQGTIKVTYRGCNDPCLSDDDADVVIEEENECDISELDLAFADDSNQSVCQFLTPFVSYNQSLINGLSERRGSVPRGNTPYSTANKISVKPKKVSVVHKTGDVSSKAQGKKSKHWPKFERIKKQINEGIKVMILMRGCSGSGKTSLARHIVKVTYGANEQKYVFSTDHYFISLGNGKYMFEPRLLSHAHEWNQKRVNEEARRGTNPIIIDNTNLEAWEMEPYVRTAVQFGYNLELLEPRTSWRNNAYELERKSTHNIPYTKIENMLARFQYDLTPAKLLSLYNLKYSPYNTPPQYTTQQRPSLCTSDLSSSGAKKKSKIKEKNEGKADKSTIKIPSPLDRNVKQIQLSGGLGCDIVDSEIKESLDKLLSEWNRSVNSHSSHKENAAVCKPSEYSQESDEQSTGIHGDPYNQNASGNISSETRVYDNDDYEEMDFKSDSTENSEDEMEVTNVSDDWEDDIVDNEDPLCNSSTLLDRSRETIDPEDVEQRENTNSMEYALVLSDGTLLPQRTHAEQNNSLQRNGRRWEYVLMTDDNSKLLFNHHEKNPLGKHDAEDNVEVKCEDIVKDTLTSVSQEKSTDQERNLKETGNIALQNSVVENTQLQCLLFPDIDVDNMACYSDFLRGPENEDKSVAQIKNKEQSLDLLVAESAALLNIAFAGVDDSTSSEGSLSTSHRTNTRNDVRSSQSPDIQTNKFDNLEVERPHLCTRREGASFNIVQTIQSTEVFKDDELSNSIGIMVDTDERNSQEELNKECFENLLNTGMSGIEHQEAKEIMVENDTNDDYLLQSTEVRKITEADLLSANVSQDNESKSDQDSGNSTCTLNTNKSKMNETDILQKWDEGTDWDDKVVLVSENVKKNIDSSTPKPARNYKRPTTISNSPEKSNREELHKVVISESWCAVNEPVASWSVESQSSNKNVEKPENKIEPQPQRQIFAESLQEINAAMEKETWIENESFDKNIGKLGNEVESQPQGQSFAESLQEINAAMAKEIPFEELKNLSNNKDTIKDHDNADVPSVMPNECSTIVEDIPELPAKAESDDKDITKHHSSVAIEKQTIAPPEDSVLVTDDLFAASCSYSINPTIERLRNVAHSSTNTHHTDFIMLSNINSGTDVETSGLKILAAFGRNIIDGESMANSYRDCRKVGQLLMLDKSSMTYDIVSSIPGIENVKEQLQELVNMFPDCSIEDLQEIFEKCNKDINWTVDLLLESASQGIEISTLNSTQRSEPKTDILVDINSLSGSRTGAQNHADRSGVEIDSDKSPMDDISEAMSFNSMHLILPASQDTSVKSPSPNKRNGKKERASVSEMSLLLKKQLEENIVINDEHYSEHVSRIRKMRHGELSDATEVAGSMQEIDACLNEFAQQQCLLDISPQEMLQQVNQTNVETNCILRPDAPEWEAIDVDCRGRNDEEEETVSLKMDSDFTEQLHNLFGTASLSLNQGAKPTLNLPLSLARQLHYYMMEAEQNTYDFMMQEDEELARKLQLQEDKVTAEAIVSTANQVPDLREIMDMEMALALYKADQKQNTTETKEDLATKLTKNLLCEWFPSLPRDVLVNVFEAHNHSFEDTLEVLLASTEEDNSVRTVMTPEARVAHEQALLVKASQEGQKSKEYSRPYSVDSEEVDQEQALEDANAYRSEASRHYNLRNECQRKAQNAYQRGLTAAAAYYSQMASLHKERIEENNAKAASSLLLAHSLGNLSTTLDLHFLYVVEALQVLDMFLDHHIHQLLDSNHRSVSVFVITGRGARSSGGRSRIKPAVVQRLDQRGLRCEEVNPGLLRVTITRNATSSNRITS